MSRPLHLVAFGLLAGACAAGSGGDEDEPDALVGFSGRTPDAAASAPGFNLDAAGTVGDAEGTVGDASDASPDDDATGGDASNAPSDDAAAPRDIAAPSDGNRPPPRLPDAAPPSQPPTMPPSEPPACGAETCNGLDDDCNGTVDDHGACGPFVERQCRLVVGWADNRRGPAGVSESWGPCPAQVEGAAGEDLRCNATRRDALFMNLDLSGNVNDDDQLAVALLCDAGQDAAVASWVETHCALFLGHADDGGGAPEGSPTWGACPDSVASNAGNQRCTSTGFDRRFRALNLTGDVDDNDFLGVAWICRDPADAGRAGAVQAAVEVWLGQADENHGPPTGSPTWGSCPGAPERARGEIRCNGTQGDGLFHSFRMEGDVDGNDDLGFALRARPVP